MTIQESLSVAISIHGLEETLNRLFLAVMEQCGPAAAQKIFVELIVASHSPKTTSQPRGEA